MSKYVKQVDMALEAIHIDGSTGYSWFGKPHVRLRPSVRRLLTADAARSYLLSQLQTTLYQNFYCQGYAASVVLKQLAYPKHDTASFVAALSAANQSAGCWEPDWEMVSSQDEYIVAQRAGLRWRADRRDCWFASCEAAVDGAMLSLRLPKEMIGISPGFYMVLGDVGFSKADLGDLLRFYWNLSPEGVLRFVRVATLELNRSKLPFRMKAVKDPGQYGRCDTLVLYMLRKDYTAAVEMLEKIYYDVFPALRDGIPGLTLQLCKGLALAEDPGDGQSFGLHRCGLLAEGIVRSSEKGDTRLSARRQSVEECFADAGVSLEQPFRRRGSGHVYAFRGKTGAVGRSIGPRGNTTDFLQISHRIATSIVREALWHRDQCNWIAPDPTVITGISYAALGPDLYAGTSGVAWFLAELYRHTGDPSMRRTAVAAIRQALLNCGSTSPFGLYTGCIGIAVAAARMGDIFSDEWLLRRASQLIRRLTRKNRDNFEFDLLSGIAGGVVGLLILHEILGDSSLLRLSQELSLHLVRMASTSGGRASWAATAYPKQQHLTGFSHGAAGAAYALVEIFQRTSVPDYRIAAEQGFSYERSWFDPREANWPDFREQKRLRKAVTSALPFVSYWCHGAPGIALSRLRAYQVLNDEVYRGEAMTALKTTSRSVRDWLASGTANYSLCHGLAGNAEVLREGCRMLGEQDGWDKGLIEEVGAAGAQSYDGSDQQWPCGTAGGRTPALMLGLAGIGHFYLRLHDSAVPSLLMPRVEDFRRSATR